MLSSTNWRVDCAIPSGSDVAAFERYAAQAPGDPAITIRSPGADDGDLAAIFSVETPALDEENAAEFGVLHFDAACESSGVGDHPGALLIAVIAPAASSAGRAMYLLAEADDLTDAHPAAAVLLAHTACEMLVREGHRVHVGRAAWPSTV